MSGNVVRCERALLLSLIKNEPNYHGPLMSQALSRTARRVMAMAFTAGTARDRELAWETAWPLLPRVFKLFFFGMRLAPTPFRLAIYAKRGLQRLILKLKGFCQAHLLP